MGSGKCSVVEWSGVECGVVWCGVLWCGVVWCGVMWSGVVWCSECSVVEEWSEVVVSGQFREVE